MAQANPTFYCTNKTCNKPFFNAYAPPKCDKCGNRSFAAFEVASAAAVEGVVKWSDHKMKHMSSPTMLKNAKNQASTKESTKYNGAAKYNMSPSEVQKLETKAFQSRNCTSGAYDAGELIGWSNGNDCTWLQLYVEDTGYHGHPITDDMVEYDDYNS